MPQPADSSQALTQSTTEEIREPEPGHADRRFAVRFWGVRGSVPVPGADTVRYGGNTSCVEVKVGGQRLVFDGGTGLRVLGQHLAHLGIAVEAHLFFTQAQWDRIQGFPFFSPAFDAATRLHIYGAAAANGASIKQCLMDQMLRPNSFTPLQTMAADLAFHNIQAGETIQLADVAIETVSLNPRTGGLGYRVTWQNRVLVYATDADLTGATTDANLTFLASGADVLILNSRDDDGARRDRIDNPLAPWESAVAIAQAANSRQLVLFHHAPCHTDEQLDALEQRLRATLPTARLAREGLILEVGV
ncbi:MAG: MBL fold metallo-hydrolase [Nodosilinea sp.]